MPTTPKEWYEADENSNPLYRQLQELRRELTSGTEQIQVLRTRLQNEMAQHNDVYAKLQQRKEFFDWLKATYPEIIEQYEVAMKLVKFMEDPPNPRLPPNKPIQSPYSFGWKNPSIAADQEIARIRKAYEKGKARGSLSTDDFDDGKL